ncbi:MAG: YbaB/EbfC family nucleoid-associated protein [Bacteroidia bacterium]|nr:YbaB/EbfC family nucleoid-associated protein [Bacteroidia bacterium]MCC7533945.1 YbaB/EbfC family nucleoid-associated protein [Bacteroidia bacterium]MCZ2141237.1 YbaB/EbfC family nucleoid-associated protein [Bacteroidia bacterium]
MFGKLAEAQKKAEEIKERLSGVTVQGQAASGDVTITMDGNKKIKDIHIDAALLLPERKEEIEDYLCVAMEDAMQKADIISAQEMKSLMGNMIPGLGGLFGK